MCLKFGTQPRLFSFFLSPLGYWLRWHYHVKDIAGPPYKIKQNTQKNQKRQNRRQSVVAGRRQLYCVVQSRSPNHSRTTTEKVVFSSRRNVVSDENRQPAATTVDGRHRSSQLVAGSMHSGKLNWTERSSSAQFSWVKFSFPLSHRYKNV